MVTEFWIIFYKYYLDSNIFTKEILQSEDNDIISNLNEMEAEINKFYLIVKIIFIYKNITGWDIAYDY